MPQMMDNQAQDQNVAVEGGPWGTIMLLLACLFTLVAIILMYMEMNLYKP